MKPIIWYNRYTRFWCLSSRNAKGVKTNVMMQSSTLGALMDWTRNNRLDNEGLRKARAH